MVILIHGDNVALSFPRLMDLKHNFAGEILAFDAKGKTSPDLQEVLYSASLLATSKLVEVQNFGLKLLDGLKVPDETTLVLYDQRQLSKTEITSLLKKFPELKIEEFKLDPVVFKFVDSLAPGNQKVMIPFWQQYVKSEQPEIAMTMLVRQFRLMLGGDDFDALSPWQKQKITLQAKKFTPDRLRDFLAAILEIDFTYKTGKSPIDLATSLELFLMAI